MIRKSHTHLNRRDGKGMDCCGGWSDGRRIRIDGLRKPRWVWVRVGGVCGKHERRYLVRTLQRELLTVWRVPTKSWPQTQVQNGLYPKERKVRHGWPLFNWVRLGPIDSKLAFSSYFTVLYSTSLVSFEWPLMHWIALKINVVITHEVETSTYDSRSLAEANFKVWGKKWEGDLIFWNEYSPFPLIWIQCIVTTFLENDQMKAVACAYLFQLIGSSPVRIHYLPCH